MKITGEEMNIYLVKEDIITKRIRKYIAEEDKGFIEEDSGLEQEEERIISNKRKK